MNKFAYRLEGNTPLLEHADNLDWADRMTAWKDDPGNKKYSKAGDDRTPACRWIGCLYNDGQHLGMPQENLMRAVMEGGAMVPVPGGKSGKTFKAQTQSGMITVAPFYPLLLNGQPLPWSAIAPLMEETDFAAHRKAVASLGFDLLVKRAKIGTAKHVRVRPMFPQGWCLDVEFYVWDDVITRDVLTSILQYAGMYKGLGDWRPGSKTPGPYGRFAVTPR